MCTAILIIITHANVTANLMHGLSPPEVRITSSFLRESESNTFHTIWGSGTPVT